MLKRIVEIILGIALAICLLSSYRDSDNPRQLMIWYIFTPTVLKVITWVLLYLLASRLIYGKGKKDYSKFFYNLFVKIFGDPKKVK